ncbi:hypothetical protein L3Q82_003613 [Scortum barcoo]|uniref:Uncharacterized protein n=1 Tax=Scortum barcoo TaxID=214431 RepID=A0ACB8VNC9_9TELE|nr:hypothetical protein L3Q82_003613 [Scortum barcoo]
MRTSVILLLLLAAASHTAAKPKNRFTRYPSWNTKMYPIWKDGDPRYKESWKGTRYRQSEPVYPTQNSDWEVVFPDGTPVKKDKKPNYVFVWKTWGQYWQVADGSSSSLTISTDDIPLGSYTMDIVIYHYRSKEKFIPLGYASTQFSITDQIPFAVSLDQVNDIAAADLRFIQNRAIAFSITLHDPSKYLSNADITFNWDFGDESGALISRELTVTHTYINSGSFKPQVVIQAVIPDKACDPPVDDPTKAPGPPTDQGTTVRAPAALASAVPLPVSTKATSLNVNMVPSDTEEDNTEDEASSASTTQPAQEAPTVAKTPSPINPDVPADSGLAAGPKRAVTLTGQATVVVVAKRDADDKPSDDDCVIYRYGSFCTGIEVFEGIEKVEIVQMNNAVMATPEMDRNVLDITVTCQGSLPKEVCSVILDAECLKPIHTSCNMVEPSKECQLVLHHFFNDSGVYCINVSMANDVSLAATSAKVNVDIGSGLSSHGTIAMVLGFLVLILAVGIVAYSYKRFKSYRPLKEDLIVSAGLQPGRAHSSSGASMFWSFLNRRGAVDNCPLLQDRPDCY